MREQVLKRKARLIYYPSEMKKSAAKNVQKFTFFLFFNQTLINFCSFIKYAFKLARLGWEIFVKNVQRLLFM